MPGPTPSQPGWYPDGDGNERWYDGNAWTDHVRGEAPGDSTVVVPPAPGTAELPVVGGPPPPPGAVPPPPWNQPGGHSPLEVGGGRGLRIAIAVVGVLLLIGVVVVGALVLFGGDDKDDDKGTDEATTPSVSETDPSSPTSSLDIPTIDPSDFPTEPPTDLPTELPTVPDLPTDFPTGLPTDFPTDPSGWESWFSDYLEEVNP